MPTATASTGQVRVTGPLAPLAGVFKSGLIDAGYRSWRPHLHLMAHLSRWLEAQGLSAEDLTGERAGEYLAARRAAGYSGLYSQRGLTPLLGFLAAQGLLRTGDPAPDSAAELLLARFSRYLLDERAVGAPTVSSYLKRVRRFLARCAAGGDVSGLSSEEVTAAVLAGCAAVSAGSAQYFVAALRSFLRFCYLEGLTGADLSAAALGVTGRRSSWLPKGMSAADVRSLLGTCDRHAENYLRLRRALGFKLTRQGEELAQLVRFCEAAGAGTLTTDLAITWARVSHGAPINWAHRLSTARAFARYLAAIDPATEIPPADVFPRGVRRPAPYLYSDSDIQRLLDAAASLTPPLRAATCVTVLGLLIATGLRVGEALRLAPGDVDLASGVLTITRAKLERSRLVPLHPSVSAALAAYAALRDALFPGSAAFFVSSAGTPLPYSTLKGTFNQLTASTGLRTPACRPRMHDFRHRFAVRVLTDAYRSGADAAARMTVLSSYLGHTEPANTYWYLSAAPELMQLAAARPDSQNGTRP